MVWASAAALASAIAGACTDDEGAHWPPVSGSGGTTQSTTSTSTTSSSGTGGGGLGGGGAAQGGGGAAQGGGGAAQGGGGAAQGGGGAAQGGGGTAAFQLLPGATVPDFILMDVNPASPKWNEPVSPRQYLMRVSGWYFGHST